MKAIQLRYLSHTETKLISDPTTAEILRKFLVLGFERPVHPLITSEEVDVFDQMYIENIGFLNNSFDGAIRLSSEGDLMTFEGAFLYDGNGPVILDIQYFGPDKEINEYSFIRADREYLREMVTTRLYDDFNGEMYQEWLSSQEIDHEQWSEDERMGN